jgi:DNA repair exonuclease SbcCD nuclease subunit
MRFSHISDTHLGQVQYNSKDREEDTYDAFKQVIDISIKDHVDFVIFAGDIFHEPNPGGTAIMHMADALKRLKKNNIEAFFILGEHDISRVRSHPVPYVYHKLEFAKYIGEGKPTYYKDVMLLGFDKIRKSEVEDFEIKFKQADEYAKEHNGHKILVMHQGITEIDKFASELSVNDMPKNFTYYAMGHLHEQRLKTFDGLGGPVAYPGSIEITSSEGIKETKKGFYEVDISSSEAKAEWIEIKTRPQLSATVEEKDVPKVVEDIIQKFKDSEKRPVIELNVTGIDHQTDIMQKHISELESQAIHCKYTIQEKEPQESIFLNKPPQINDEMLKLASETIDSEKVANFALKELLPLLTSNQLEQANQLILENYKQYRKGIEEKGV